MLIGNGRLTDKIPLTLLGCDWNAQLQAGALVGMTEPNNLGPLAALPNGYYQPHGWMLPRKGGSLRAGRLSGTGSASATGQSGYNIDGTISGSGGVDDAQTFLGLIVSLIATISGEGVVNTAIISAITNLLATISGEGTVDATAAGLADLAALVAGESAVNPNNTALMDIAASLRGYSDLTPEGIRDLVWNATASSYDDAGSMGEKLNGAGSAGNPWTEVIESGFTAAQILRLLAAHAAGSAANLEGASPSFTGLDGLTTRITATYSAGTRTITSLDGA